MRHAIITFMILILPLHAFGWKYDDYTHPTSNKIYEYSLLAGYGMIDPHNEALMSIYCHNNKLIMLLGIDGYFFRTVTVMLHFEGSRTEILKAKRRGGETKMVLMVIDSMANEFEKNSALTLVAYNNRTYVKDIFEFKISGFSKKKLCNPKNG